MGLVLGKTLRARPGRLLWVAARRSWNRPELNSTGRKHATLARENAAEIAKACGEEAVTTLILPGKVQVQGSHERRKHVSLCAHGGGGAGERATPCMPKSQKSKGGKQRERKPGFFDKPAQRQDVTPPIPKASRTEERREGEQGANLVHYV